MFNDNGFSLLDQRALSFSGASKPLNTQQPYHSSATRSVLPTEMNFPTDMPCISSLPGRSSKYDSSETLQNPIDKTNFFYQRMKMLAANFQDHNASLPSTSDVKEERNAVETGLNWTKAAQTQPNSTPVSPRSPRHIGWRKTFFFHVVSSTSTASVLKMFWFIKLLKHVVLNVYFVFLLIEIFVVLISEAKS